jgi:hypothetical protein
LIPVCFAIARASRFAVMPMCTVELLRDWGEVLAADQLALRCLDRDDHVLAE